MVTEREKPEMTDSEPREPAPGSRTGEAIAPTDEFQPLPRRQVVLTMGGVMLAIFLASLDQTVVSTAMPRIVADLGGFDRFTWVTTAYLVASTTAVPIVGRLSDLYGRKGFFIAGIVIFLGGSVLAGVSQTMNQLIAFRAVQGVGGGIMMANAFVSIGDLFAPADRGKNQGLVAAAFGLSSVIGPTLGGFITDAFSWHWIFFVNIPLGIPVIVLFVRFFPQSRRSGARHRLDYLGMAALVMTVVPLLVGLSLGGSQYEWVSPQVIGPLAVSAAMVVVFILVELRAAEPIMPLDMYRNRMVSLSLIAIFFVGFGMFGAIIFVPLFFQGVLGASATSSGSFLTPMMLGVVVGAALSGQILSRLGGHYRLQGLSGIGIMVIGMFLISRMSADTGYGYAVSSIVVVGFGLGSTFPVYTIAVQNAVPHRIMGVATSATQFYRSIGGTLGLAVLGSFMVNRFASGVSSNLSPDVGQALPPGSLSQIVNRPQALMDPDALSRLRASFDHLGPQGADLSDHLLAVLRDALASAIGDVFLISMVVVAAGFVVTLFIREIPLQRRSESAERGGAAESA